MKSSFSGWRYLWKSEDIRRKLLITFFILALYRVAADVPVPGINFVALKAFRASAASSAGFLGFLDLLSGGTVTNFSLLSMGVYPYITAQIILQLLIPIIPALQRRMQEDRAKGRSGWSVGRISLPCRWRRFQQSGRSTSSTRYPFRRNKERLFLLALAVICGCLRSPFCW